MNWDWGDQGMNWELGTRGVKGLGNLSNSVSEHP